MEFEMYKAERKKCNIPVDGTWQETLNEKKMKR
jgi:hypothetical protein